MWEPRSSYSACHVASGTRHGPFRPSHLSAIAGECGAQTHFQNLPAGMPWTADQGALIEPHARQPEVTDLTPLPPSAVSHLSGPLTSMDGDGARLA